MNIVWSQIEVGRPIYTVSQVVVGDKWLAEPPFIGRRVNCPTRLTSHSPRLWEFSPPHFTFHSWTFGTETRLAVASYRNYSEIMRIKMEKSSVPLLIFVFPTPASGFVGGQSLSSRYPLKPQGSIISEKRVGKLIVRLIIAEITKGITVISLAQTIWMLYTVLTRANYTFCKDFSLSDI